MPTEKEAWQHTAWLTSQHPVLHYFHSLGFATGDLQSSCVWGRHSQWVLSLPWVPKRLLGWKGVAWCWPRINSWSRMKTCANHLSMYWVVTVTVIFWILIQCLIDLGTMKPIHQTCGKKRSMSGTPPFKYNSSNQSIFTPSNPSFLMPPPAQQPLLRWR